MNPQQEAYERGCKDYHDGKAHDENPYKCGTPKAYLRIPWFLGWQHAAEGDCDNG